MREKLASGGVFGIKSGDAGKQGLLGFKAAGFWAVNRILGGEPHTATILLFDPDSGRPLCVIDGNIVTTLSKHPFVAEHRELIHKIGVTGGRVETRIAGAEKDATYLLADAEVVATYKLHNLNRTKLENIFHRLFGAAQIYLTIEDHFECAVKPREWFLAWMLHEFDGRAVSLFHGIFFNFWRRSPYPGWRDEAWSGS